MDKKKWNGVTGGGELGQIGLRWLLKHFDVRLCYLPIYFVVPFYFIFAYKRALSIYHYFHNRHHFNRFKSFWYTYQNHVEFGKLLLDRFAIYSGQRNKFHIETTGQEQWDEANESAKGCFVIGSHIGNFEIAGYLLGIPVKKMNCVIYGKDAREMLKYRSETFKENNIDLIPLEGDFSHIFLINQALQRHEIISITCDRVTSGNRSIETMFMGAKATFPIGAFSIAANHNENMLTVYVMREKNLHYHVYVKAINISSDIKSINDKIKALLQGYVNETEHILQIYPKQWYNFFEFWNE